MRVSFVLTMYDAVVANQYFDVISIVWDDDHSVREIQEMSHRWIVEKNFLTNKMEGLTKVGESCLTIEPHEDISEFIIG